MAQARLVSSRGCGGAPRQLRLEGHAIEHALAPSRSRQSAEHRRARGDGRAHAYVRCGFGTVFTR